MGIGLDTLPKLGYQPPTAQNGVRTISEEALLQARKEQETARRNAGIRRSDDGGFFLEYFRYRDNMVAKSPVKMAQVMAKTKADDMSKSTAGQEDGKEEQDAVRAVAEELGVSVEQLTIAVDGDATLSELVKDLACAVSQKGTEERHQRKMPGSADAEPESEKNRAAAIRRRAAELERAAAALKDGGITTGTVPGAEALQSQAELYKKLAGLADVFTGM